ncbi:hypothetical protein SAMN02800694_1459 [Luteibacter sp. UNCMF331Sha3.1]|uniref:hypothetical protein n=1 Tax=Luteibacter sp. UNCMF331Sha3.1 TaxID=1502760 RepID=UPI0008C5777C|nr:hypothetical protein [Luteibacter sp. UNCMF331Sha3.1]SEM54585.1 hypothetical protein SAMN02800694_1459 [Luteibacter sp. UNCMF331Sha3.1]
MAKLGESKRRFDSISVSPNTNGRPALRTEDGRLEFLASATDREGELWIDCSFLLELKTLWEDAAKVLSHLATGYRIATYTGWMTNLKHGIVRFARETSSAGTLAVSDLNTQWINRYIDESLSRTAPDGTYVLGYNTRFHRLSILKKLLDGMRELGMPLPTDSEVRENPWPGAARGEVRPQREEKSRDETLDFYVHCRQSVAATMKFVEGLWEDERLAEQYLQDGSLSAVQRERAVAGLIVREAKMKFGAALPERQHLQVKHPTEFRRIQAYGYRRMIRNFGPYAADLCAFVYHLAHATGINLQALVDFDASEVQHYRRVGGDMVHVATVKQRAKVVKTGSGSPIEKRYPVDDDPTSPGNVFIFLLRWTSYLRENSDHPYTRYLFCFIGRNRADPSELDTYAMVKKRGGRTEFERHMTHFCQDGGFRWTGLREIRGDVADLVDEDSSGDTALTGTFLDHKSLNTTRTHYQKGETLQRRQRQFGHAMERHQRWAISNGRVEPRDMPEGYDATAATDGFRCVDPYASPIAGQREGRLCTAFAECPGCPMAMIDLNDTRAAARCGQLAERFLQLRPTMGDAAFHARWGNAYEALIKVWLPAFPEPVFTAGAQRLLPSLPVIE